MQAFSKDMVKKGSDLASAYRELVETGRITADPAQHKVIERLQALNDALLAPRRKGWFRRDTSPAPRGLYLYGDVGRGKSMLMDLTFTFCPLEAKRRVHFHAFMMEVHETLHRWRQDPAIAGEDLIPRLAKSIANQASLLCFDEFQVHDIADAMILGRLFTGLFAEGVTVIATSNRLPDDLYKDGLQREHFLPFIALLKQKTEVVKLDSPQDYRLKHLKSMETTYLVATGKAADAFITQSFAALTNGAIPQPMTLTVLGRDILIENTHGDVAMLTFHALCEQPLGAADYIEIAREFNTLLLADIPVLTPEKRNEAKRFVTLIDALYEHKVKLLCTAEAPSAALYPEGQGAFEFQRTVSRLMEMQSDAYLAEGHLG